MSADTDAIVINCLTVAQLPEAHVPSVRLACDVCGALIWASVDIIQMVSDRMGDMPDASVMYVCYNQHDDEMGIADKEYSCHVCDATYPDPDDLVRHYAHVHRQLMQYPPKGATS